MPLAMKAIIEHQIVLLVGLIDALIPKAIEGTVDDQQRLFDAQSQLQHWMSQLVPTLDSPYLDMSDAPAPLPGMRQQAPPLPHEQADYLAAMRQWQQEEDSQQRPSVSFGAPDPLWVEDLERPQEPDV